MSSVALEEFSQVQENNSGDITWLILALAESQHIHNQSLHYTLRASKVGR